MKKLLGILVMGLLWYNVSFAEIFLTKCSFNLLSGKKSSTTLYLEWTLYPNEMVASKKYYYSAEGEKKYGEKIARRDNIKLIKINDVTYRTELMQSGTQPKHSYADVINIKTGMIRSAVYSSKDKRLIKEVAWHECKDIKIRK